MVIKKSNAILAAVATAVVFYFIGAFFPLSFIYSDLVAGDIGKAKTYRSASSEDINAAMELLASSKDVQQSTITASLILSNRVMEMDSLAKASLRATEGIAELAGLHQKFEGVCMRTSNALDAFTRYNQEMSKVIDGKTSKLYEQCANNAYIAFSVLENNLHNSGAMIDEIAAYLQKNQNRELDALACAWIEFGAEDAFLSGSEKDYDKWKAAYANLSGATGTPAMPFPAPATVAFNCGVIYANAICNREVGDIVGFGDKAWGLVLSQAENYVNAVEKDNLGISGGETELVNSLSMPGGLSDKMKVVMARNMAENLGVNVDHIGYSAGTVGANANDVFNAVMRPDIDPAKASATINSINRINAVDFNVVQNVFNTEMIALAPTIKCANENLCSSLSNTLLGLSSVDNLGAVIW